MPGHPHPPGEEVVLRKLLALLGPHVATVVEGVLIIGEIVYVLLADEIDDDD